MKVSICRLSRKSWKSKTYLTGGHHHAATDGVKGVRGDTGTSGDGPSEKERGKEVALEGASEEDGLDGVVHAEVETTVDNDTGDGGHEATVETGNTVRGEGLLVDIHQAVELTLTTRLGVLGVVGKTSTGVVEGVDEEEGSGTSGTTRGKVAGHPPPVAVTLLLEGEHGLVGVAESEVQGLGREVTDNVGGVSAPEGGGALLSDDTLEALANAGVGLGETARAEHLILFDVVRRCSKWRDGARVACDVCSWSYANATRWYNERKRLTWFWMRSLTRSMGAAAVLETAAEIPPTVVQC
jgi:hypothetical protein